MSISREFNISGMHFCEDAVVNGLKALPGIVKAQADYRRQTAKVHSDARLSREIDIGRRSEN